MKTTLLALALFASTSACDKAKTEKLRTDGFTCQTENQKGGLYVPKPGEHCFKCPSSDAVSKCTTDPLNSGCHEVPLKECSP
jgi:hypothetical protein